LQFSKFSLEKLLIMTEYKSNVEAVDALRLAFEKLMQEIKKVIIGQDEIVKHTLITIFSGGHCLLVGVPGLAKTLLVNTISEALGLEYKRIQFTPDLMPSDIIGSEILGENREFTFVKGPLFANIILADEINRTPPKTQSALLEAMQEKAVTASGKKYKLQEPFFVLATQNPIEQEGTYPLPEAQLDRFMFNIWLDYPDLEDEIRIVSETTSNKKNSVEKVLEGDEIIFFQELIRKVPVNDNVLRYAVNLASRTRPGTKHALPITDQFISWGAGPRASQYLILAAKTHAVINGKYSPDIEDVNAVAVPVLRHRLVRNYKAEAENKTVEEIIAQVIKSLD